MLLTLDKVNSFYGQLHVLWDVSIEVKEKSITGLIGPNGAGKSTLLKTILGAVPARSGTIRLRSTKIERMPTKLIVQSGVIYVPEGRRVFQDMTVYENLNLGVMSRKAHEEKEQNLKEVYEIFPLLKERKAQLAGTLSGGELQLLALGRGLMGAPDLLMVDEPSLGLSPVAVNNVFNTIRQINSRGKTVLIVEQNVPRLLNLASFAYVLENGRIVSSGYSTDLEKDQYISKSYLGI
ncbi:MAG TPA: ABC transporter ATP-binding protein [Nitrososphaerales archaeon]|nr:ABC transporter ATP-binding protein [Nitrososphaerales archaeon]